MAWGSFSPRDRDGRVLPMSALPTWVADKVREGRAALRAAARRAEEARAEAERRARAERRKARAEAARLEAERLEAARQERNRRRRERTQAARAEAARIEAERQERNRRRRERAQAARAEAARLEAERKRLAAERREAERLAAERAARRGLPHDASGQVLVEGSAPRNKAGNAIDWADVRVFDGDGQRLPKSRWPAWLRKKVAAAERARAATETAVKGRGQEVVAQIEGDRRRFGKEIVTAQEVLEAVLVEARNKALAAGAIERWTSDPTLVRGSRGGLGRQVAIGSLLDRDTAADIRAVVREVAEEVADTMRDDRTKVFVSIFLSEFGKNLIGSPTKVVMELPEGVMTQGWQAVRGGKPERVARRVGALLDKILAQSPRNAAIVEGIVVRGYITRGDGK